MIGRILGPHGGDELAFEPLADEPHSAVARAGHPLSARADLRHADLARYGWVLPPMDSVLRAPGRDVHGARRAGSAEHHRDLVAAGHD